MKYGFLSKYGFSLCFSTKNENFNIHKIKFYDIFVCTRSYGVMVSTQDSESCDPSSNLGRTWPNFSNKYHFIDRYLWLNLELGQAWWRNGSASDSSSEGCVFKSRPGQKTVLQKSAHANNSLNSQILRNLATQPYFSYFAFFSFRDGVE